MDPVTLKTHSLTHPTPACKNLNRQYKSIRPVPGSEDYRNKQIIRVQSIDRDMRDAQLTCKEKKTIERRNQTPSG